MTAPTETTSRPMSCLRHIPSPGGVRRALRGICVLASCAAATSATANEYWDRYADKPVEIQQGERGQAMRFVDFEDGMLMAQLDDGAGEVSMPVNEGMVRTLRLDLGIMTRVRDLINRERYDAALEVMRPEVYPLIKFHQLPDNFTQLHVPIRTMVETLIDAGELSEAKDVLQRIELDQTPVEYSEIAVDLMNTYLGNENYENTVDVARLIPVEGKYSVNIRPILDAADALRGAGLYAEVIPFYRDIEQAVPENLRDNVRMWLAYSLVLADRVDEATKIIEELSEPEKDNRLFSLYKLLEGSRAYRTENYENALDLLTRGFVRAQSSYSWVPEMLFLIGDCYKFVDDPRAARNAWTEVSVLYPNSPWSTRAEASLKELPSGDQSAN